jgi:selenide,water dikinase
MLVNSADSAMQGHSEALLYDPQTAGGLLAAVPKEQSMAVIDALAAKGCKGHVIGQLTKGTGRMCLNEHAP